MQPLPDLRPADFGGGGVFHQVVKRDAAIAAEPGFQVLDADFQIQAYAFFGDIASAGRQEVGG